MGFERPAAFSRIAARLSGCQRLPDAGCGSVGARDSALGIGSRRLHDGADLPSDSSDGFTSCSVSPLARLCRRSARWRARVLSAAQALHAALIARSSAPSAKFTPVEFNAIATVEARRIDDARMRRFQCARPPSGSDVTTASAGRRASDDAIHERRVRAVLQQPAHEVRQQIFACGPTGER